MRDSKGTLEMLVQAKRSPSTMESHVDRSANSQDSLYYQKQELDVKREREKGRRQKEVAALRFDRRTSGL
jgi:hypothetical protein